MNRTTIAIAAAIGIFACPSQAETKVDFLKDIKPILEQACVKCHGADKQKGKLRLDSKHAVLKRGEGDEIVVPGDAAKSELYRRVALPPGDDDIMPNEGDPLPKNQIDLLRDWINQGALWPDDAVFAGATAVPRPEDLKAMAFKPTGDETKALAALEALGISVRPIAMNVPWREASLHLLGSNVTDGTVAPFKDVMSLVNLNLGGTKVSDKALAHLAGNTNLARLHLEKTEVTDNGLASLRGLVSLEYLNLYGTSVSDKGLEHLKGLTNLRNLYLWQTQVTDDGVAALKQALPGLNIVRGTELKVTAKEEPKEEAKK